MKHTFFYGIMLPACLAVLLICAGLLGSAGAQTASAGKQEIRRTDAVAAENNSNMGKRFPDVVAESLAGTQESIPDSARGKVTLVVVAFLRESQAQLDSWLEPFIARFGSRKDFMFYEVPMISSGYKFMRLMIDGGMRAGIPNEKHRHVVTMYGDVEKYKNALNLDPRFGHAFVLDREGIIRWQGKGFATGETLADMAAAAERLSQTQPGKD